MAFRLSFFYAALFLTIGIMMPFWPVWLKSRGLNAAEIGQILAVAMWLRAFTSPMLAQYADRRGRPDRLAMLLGWSALAVNCLFFLTHDFWTILAVSILSTMSFTALMPLGDAVTMLKVREGTLDYGRVRLWGSIAFIVAATGSGYLLDGRPPSAILWLIIGGLALTVIGCHLIPRAETPGSSSFLAPMRALLQERRVIVFMIAASLVQASHAVYYGFATLHWQAEGLSDGVIGALWAEGVICEVALFAFSGAVVARFGPVALLAMGAGAGLLRWLVLGTTTDIWALVAVQGLHALTFGATHLAAMHYIAQNVPAQFASTAQSVYSSFFGGTIMALAMLSSGWLFETYRGDAFTAMIVLPAVALLLAAVGLRASRQ
jgi:PPP family 3-phenylpropionic acid transporter